MNERYLPQAQKLGPKYRHDSDAFLEQERLKLD